MSPKKRQARHIGDLHFLDPKVSALRGFASVVEHDAAVIEDWNRSVPDDHTPVYVYGDICKGNTESWHHALEIIAALPGRKRLISGNHDKTHPMHTSWAGYLTPALQAFESVTTASAINLAGRTVMQSHLPYYGDHVGADRYDQWRLRNEGKWLAHAHVHDEWTVYGRQINLSWEKWRGGFATDNDLIALITRGERMEGLAEASAVAAALESRGLIMEHGGGS